METHSTSDEVSNKSNESKPDDPSYGIEADYGEEEEEGEEEAYAFEKEGDNILDKNEDDSDVEEFMEAMEEEELQKDNLKLDDDEDDYGSESGKGLDDYGSEDEELNAFDQMEEE